MKSKVQPIASQRVMRPDEFIVSKSDPAGLITYGNRSFITYSGYGEAELLGQPHSLLRHPDMPRALFHLLWTTLKGGEECFAYIKNLAKDGSYYWSFASLAPCYDDQNRVNGYLDRKSVV